MYIYNNELESDAEKYELRRSFWIFECFTKYQVP